MAEGLAVFRHEDDVGKAPEMPLCCIVKIDLAALSETTARRRMC